MTGWMDGHSDGMELGRTFVRTDGCSDGRTEILPCDLKNFFPSRSAAQKEGRKKGKYKFQNEWYGKTFPTAGESRKGNQDMRRQSHLEFMDAGQQQ